jgi:hypothetical protein
MNVTNVTRCSPCVATCPMTRRWKPWLNCGHSLDSHLIKSAFHPLFRLLRIA